MAIEIPIVTPVPHASTSQVDFGAVVTNIDIANLSDNAFSILESALYTHKVLIIPSQSHLTPKQQFDFVCRFDPTASPDHGHHGATKALEGKESLLNGIGNDIGLHPEVKLVGGGKQDERFGGKTLRQADHTLYHKTPLSQEERDQGFTRWHRWHMDAALYKTDLPLLTTLLAVKVPQGPPLKVRWDDGSNNTMQIAAGSTAFISGAKMYQLLSEENKRVAENSLVEYAPHPYQWGGANKGNSNGLGVVSEGKELPLEELPEWDEQDIKVWPMVWTHPRTGEKSLQVHSVGVWKLKLRSSPAEDFRTITDLVEIRKILYELQRPAIEPEHIFVPAYKEGDLVLFSNRQVYHSATDYPDSYGTRTMLQAHIAASYPPS